VTVRTLLHDAREVLSIARRAARKLVRAGLDERVVRELPRRIELVAEAEEAWRKQLARTTPAALRAARDEAMQLRVDMMAAARFLLRKDSRAQLDLDRMAHGDDLEALMSGLRALARFYERFEQGLRGADVPADAIGRARELAAQLMLLRESEGRDLRTRALESHRIGTIARLEDAVREVRAAGRYVFRNVPARAAIFREEFRHAVERHHETKASTRSRAA
jgi:hypothetical protein